MDCVLGTMDGGEAEDRMMTDAEVGKMMESAMESVRANGLSGPSDSESGGEQESKEDFDDVPGSPAGLRAPAGA